MTNYLHLDGTQGHVTASGYKGVAGPGKSAFDPRSIAFWIRSTQSGVSSSIVYWGDNFSPSGEAGSQNRVRLSTAGRVQLFSKTSYIETASGILDNQWHHLAFTYQGGLRGEEDQVRVRNFADADVYLDGKLNNGRWFEDGITGVVTAPEHDVVIGARPLLSGTLTDFFEGDLDEIGIWRIELTPSAVSGIYDGGVRGSADLKALEGNDALELWYDMDDPSDSAPNGQLVNQAKALSPFPGSGITSAGTSIVV